MVVNSQQLGPAPLLGAALGDPKDSGERWSGFVGIHLSASAASSVTLGIAVFVYLVSSV